MRINTIEAVRELIDRLGGGYRGPARILGTSHTALWHALEGDRPPPTLDTLARWASKAKEEAGIELTFTVEPGADLNWTITLSE